MALERRDGYWLWVGGPVPPGYSGITIWSLISVRRDVAGDNHLLRHELEHVRQWHQYGPIGFLRRYVGAYLALRLAGHGHGAAYRRIPFEVEAERAAIDAESASGDGAPPAIS
ncbi:MAG TPA: hypothetical protein VM121_00935 [Acidimicrobiales bacterium]|nr:hypothetical protein [Acidimicrobiales bacterium]